MSNAGIGTPWSPAPNSEVGATIDHLHRLSQIAGNYTLDQIYERFVTAAATVGVPAPGSTIEPEIDAAPHFDDDTQERPDVRAVALWAASAFSDASNALIEWQAPYRGHRPRVGIMWGGFDVSATRYRHRPVTPPETAPMFQRNGMTEEVVAVGFVIGDDDTPARFYAYVSPPPDGFGSVDLALPGASYDPDAGLAILPWSAALETPDPLTRGTAPGDHRIRPHIPTSMYCRDYRTAVGGVATWDM